MAINAWCWDASSRQRGGPAGIYCPARLQALIRAYIRRRPLFDTDFFQLADDLRLSALRTAIHRIKNYELSRRPKEIYEDYRHYTARLRALAQDRALDLINLSGLDESAETTAPRA